MRRVSAIILALCLVLTEGHLSYLGSALGLGKGVGTAYAAVEWTYDDEYTLYNFANINGSGQFGLLRRTYINTVNDLDYYVSTIQASGNAATENVSTDEITEITPYNFSGEILYVSNKGTNNTTYNGTYIYFGDAADYSAHPENYPEIDGVFYVTEVKPVIIVRKKIGGSGYECLTVDNDISLTPRKSYHRDYTVYTVKGTPESQVLFNFLDIQGVTNGNNLYRLVDTSSIAFIDANQNRNFLIHPNTNSLHMSMYKDMGLEEFDFANHVLDVTYGGVTLPYVYKSSDYVPEDEYFEPYYTIEVKKLSVETQLNHHQEWFENPNGWIGGDDHSDWDGYDNDTVAYHRDYLATLHKSSHKVNVVWKDSDGTVLETDANVVGGTVPHYDGTAPAKASDSLYDYEWAGWSDGTNTYAPGDPLPKISSPDDITYTAVYNVTPKFATVTGYEGEYDKESHSITVELNDGIEATVEYSVKDTNGTTWSDWSTEAPAETNVCDKQVRVRVTYNEITSEVADPVVLKITKATAAVTVTGNNSTAVYDGADHSVTGYTFTSTNPKYTQDDFTYSGSQTATRKDVGTTQMGLNNGTFTNTNPNFESVTFSVTDGYQIITANEDEIIVTITGHSNTSDYDGSEHTASGYEVTINNDLYTEDDFSFSGTAEAKRTDAGTSEMGLDASQFVNTNTNFSDVTFVIIDGYQQIDPIDVTVTIVGANNTSDYDGQAHSVTGYTASADSTLYDVDADIEFSGEATASQTDVGTAYMGLTAAMFANNNPNFRTVMFEITDGYQKVEPIDVTVTIIGKTESFDYDGQAHTVTGYTATTDNDLFDVDSDITFDGDATATRTDAGTTGMNLTSAMFSCNNPNFGTVTFNVTDGSVTIDPINVTVTIVGANDTVDYDGSEHTVSGYTATADTNLYDVDNDFTFNGEASAKRTDAGTTNMGLDASQFTNTNPNFATVTFAITDGYITISQINVTVTIVGTNETVDYDGEEHTVSGYTATVDTNLYDVDNDFTFSGTAEAKRTDAGTTEMGLAEDQFENINPNFATVTFAITDGFITINPIDVTVTIVGANSAVDYDGQEHSVSGYTATADSDLYDVDNDFTFSGSAEAKRTDAGTTNMGLAAGQFTNTNPNFATVTFAITDGFIQIDPIAVVVTITGKTDTAVYNGEDHTVNGYDVEISNPLYTEDDFAFNGSASATQRNVGKAEMGLNEDQFENTNPNFESVTFEVTDGYQEITPLTVNVTITGNTDTVSYDGNEHTVTGYVVTSDSTLFTEADVLINWEGPVEVKGTDAGTYEMGLTEDLFRTENPNFAATFTVEDGSLVINPIDVTVTITGNNDSVDYDGTEHMVAGYTATADSDLYNVDTDFTFSGTDEVKRTDAGTSEMGLAANQFTNTNPNFGTVTFVIERDGSITINPIDVTVTVTGNNDTVDYDNEEHTVSGYTATADSDLYDVDNDFTFSGTAEAKRTDAGTTEMGLAEDQFENTNPNFATVTFEITDGSITINPIDVTVTIVGNNETVDFDNEEHAVSGYTATADSDLYDVDNDFTFSGTAEAKRTEVGTTEMGLAANQFENTNPNFATVTFEITDGFIQIDPISVVVTISGKTDTAVYNGEDHTVNGYDVEISNPLYTEADFTFNGTASATQQNVGKAEMGLAANQFENTNPNFESVTFEVTDGYQEITPLAVNVTITGNTDTVSYDGTEHTVTGYVVTSDSTLFTEADVLINWEGPVEVKGTDAGTYEMGLTEDLFRTENPNFEATFAVEDGSLVINPIDVTVTITGNNDSVDYDGTEHMVAGFTATADSNLYNVDSDFTFSGTAEVGRTEAGTTEMGLASNQFTNTNPNFATVTFNVTDGYITINPINVTVTITGATESKDYDGQEHEVSGYTATADSNLYDIERDFTFSGTAEAKRTDAGTTEMGLTEDQFENTNPNFATVTFEITDGSITINPIDVTVTIVGENNTSDYDGAEHSVSGYTATADSDLYNIERDFTFSGTAEAKRTNAGTTNMGLAADQFENTNTNFGTVTFEITDGYQTINPIDVTVTIIGATDVTNYDGQEHTVSGYTATADSDLYNAENFFTFSGEAVANRTDAGTTYMGLAADQFVNINGNFGTVTFEITDGSITINPINVTVTITGATDTTDYDGAEHSVSGYTATADSDLYDVENDFTFSGTAEAKRTDAGTTNMGLAANQFENTNTNFGTVTFEITDGSITINPINVTVTITGATDTTDYDGQEHEVSGYTATADSDLYDVDNDFTFSGTAEAKRTDAGTTNMGLTEDQFENTNTNFATVTFEVTDGSITINPINVTVTITGATESKDYDGQEHSVSGYTATADSDLYDVENDFTFSGTAEAKRTNAGTTNMGLAADQFENINGNFGTVTFNVTDGSITINPIDVTVTITGANNATDFDGQEHSVSGYTATADSDLYDVENDFTFSGTAEAKRTNAGTTNMGLAADQFENTNTNFGTVTFEITDGYQTINAIDVTVTITGATETKDYDGTEHTVSGYTATADSDLYDVDTFFNFSGNAEAKRTDAGTTNMGLAADQFENINGNFANVTFEITDGSITITPIDVTVTITGANDTSDYDGNEHTVSGYTAVADSDLYDVENDFTFSGTAEAKQTNAGTAEMGLAADQFENTNPNFATVTFNVTDGFQTITPLAITIKVTGDREISEYDATEHTAAGFTYSIDSMLYNVLNIKFNGTAEVSRTDAGTTYMGLTADQFENKDTNFEVTFDVTDGYVWITEIDEVVVTITGHTLEESYDATGKTVSGYDVEISNALYKETDFTFSGSAEVSGKNAAKTMMGLTEDMFANTNTNFTKVTFVVTDGYLLINPAEVTVTADNITITEGDEEPNLTITAELFGDDTIEYTIKREPGTTPGTYVITVTGDECQGNYHLTFVNGTFTIEVPVEYTYGGKDHQTWYKNSNVSLEFKFERNVDNAAAIDHFVKFLVDGNAVPADKCDVRSGSVIVTLKPEYLQTLALGEHTIVAYFDDGNIDVSAGFTVLEQKDPYPATGDGFDASLMLALMLSSAGAFFMILFGRRRRKEEA